MLFSCETLFYFHFSELLSILATVVPPAVKHTGLTGRTVLVVLLLAVAHSYTGPPSLGQHWGGLGEGGTAVVPLLPRVGVTPEVVLSSARTAVQARLVVPDKIFEIITKNIKHVQPCVLRVRGAIIPMGIAGLSSRESEIKSN